MQALPTSAGEAAIGGWPAWWGDGNQLSVPQASRAIHGHMVSKSSIFHSRGDQGSESQRAKPPISTVTLVQGFPTLTVNLQEAL